MSGARAVVRGNSRRDALGLVVVVGISWIVRFLFLRWKAPDAISHDLIAWGEVSKELSRGVNPYLSTTYLSWPPLWLQILFLLQKASAALHVSVANAVVLVLIATETAGIVVLFRLFGAMGARRRVALLLLGIAVNPVSALLVCQHGNFDVLVGLDILLFVASLRRFRETERPEDWLFACLCLGIGIALKTIPLVLLPLLLFGIRRRSPLLRAIGAVLALGPGAYGLSVLYVLAPARIAERVIGYRSGGRWFAVPGLLHLFHRDAWIPPYAKLFQLALLAAMAGFALVFLGATRLSDRQLILVPLFLLAAIPSFGPGYGPQYVHWFWFLLPLAWAAGSGLVRRAVAVFAGIASLTYAIEYAFVPVLGAFLLRTRPADSNPLLAGFFNLASTVTLLRLPLFGAYALLLGVVLAELVAEARPFGVPATARRVAGRVGIAAD